MLLEAFMIVIVSFSIQCSLVIDAENQKGIYVSDYCPKMKYCPEGSHVLCMYYDKNNVMGPRCRDARNISINTELANKLLDVTNALRSKLARGQERGKNGNPLPRGYGIFRLRWDSELATFAQLLANQCMLRLDFCRATKKFPDPGQTASIVRFHGPEWIPASKTGKFTTTGLSEEKLVYAITQTLRTWYRQKSNVDIHMVTNYPDWNKTPASQNGRLYLTMTYGSATHMGCGISAYSEYVFVDQRVSVLYNNVLVICNFSAQPHLGAGVYNTVPPTDTESSFNACGCPIGSLADDDCLCLEVPRDTEPQITDKTAKCPPGMNCDPTVVVLPIFTVEDAPPEKLVFPLEGFANESTRDGNIPENDNVIDSFEDLFNSNLKGDKGVLQKSRKTLDLQHGNSYRKKQGPLLHSNMVTVRNRHFEKPNEANDHKDLDNMPRKQLQGHIQKPSVFIKPIFELPGSHYLLSSTKKNVAPRKDFTIGKQLVNKYLYGKTNMILSKEHNNENNLNEVKTIDTAQLPKKALVTKLKEHRRNLEYHDDVHFHDILTTETILNKAEQEIINYGDSNEIKHQVYDKFDNNTVTNENDNKFLALLDTLEKEVKHIELRDKEKQIFDAKIKKIYGEVVGKLNNKDNTYKSEDDESVVLKLPPSFDAVDDSNFIDEPSYDKHITDTEIDDKYPKTDLDNVGPNEIQRPIAKKQNSLLNYGGRDKYTRRNRNFRQNNRNYLSSDSVRQRYENERGRKPYKNGLRKLRRRTNSLDYKRNQNYYSNNGYEDNLSTERIKYYQDKLDSMERKLQDARRYNRRNDYARHVQVITESIVDHIVKELKTRFPEITKRMTKDKLNKIAGDLNAMIQILKRKRILTKNLQKIGKKNTTSGTSVFWKKKLMFNTNTFKNNRYSLSFIIFITHLHYAAKMTFHEIILKWKCK